MRYRSLFTFFWFGTCLRYLLDARNGAPFKGEGFIEQNIKSFFSYLNTFELHVTKLVAEDRLKDIMERLSEYGDEGTLTSEDAHDLREAVATIRITLEAELKGIGAYMPTPKRIDLKKLLENIAELFAPGVIDDLPETTRYDFGQAGRCIAFELPTAAAFHILRATEDVLRFYYQNMVRKNRISNRNWGPIVSDLRTRPRTKKYDVLNNHLDNIRNSFRNPTQHPDAVYDIHGAQDLWSLCVDVVNRIVQILRDEDRI